MGTVGSWTWYVLVHRSRDSLSLGSERGHDCLGDAPDVVVVVVDVIVAFSAS